MSTTPTLGQPPTQASAPARTRTASHAKWLLNEHAALAGREAQLASRISLLQAELTQVQASMAALRASAQLFTGLDGLAELLGRSAGEAPAVAGAAGATEPARAVTPWKGKYGRRGALRDFILELLQRAHPQALTALDIGDLAVQNFALGTLSAGELRKYRESTIRPQLRAFKEQGLVEPQPTRHPVHGDCTAWRWLDPMPSVAGLASLAEMAGLAGYVGHAAERGNAVASRSDEPQG